jgi:hypothetical protein
LPGVCRSHRTAVAIIALAGDFSVCGTLCFCT